MARYPRLVVPELPHHVTQRGNRGQVVFRSVDDRSQYCRYARRYLSETGVRVLAFCLMPNHVHFILVPPDADSLSRYIQLMHTAYALYSNTVWHCSGHLWQGRFYSCALDETHLYNAVRYVELNPVRAGMIDDPSSYCWSSARAHLLGSQPLINLDMEESWLKGIDRWEHFLGGSFRDDYRMLRDKTKTGRPCCTIETCLRIEEETGRSVLPDRSALRRITSRNRQ